MTLRNRTALRRTCPSALEGNNNATLQFSTRQCWTLLDATGPSALEGRNGTKLHCTLRHPTSHAQTPPSALEGSKQDKTVRAFSCLSDTFQDPTRLSTLKEETMAVDIQEPTLTAEVNKLMDAVTALQACMEHTLFGDVAPSVCGKTPAVSPNRIKTLIQQIAEATAAVEHCMVFFKTECADKL